MRKVEPMRRANRAAGGPIPRLKRGFHILGLPTAGTDMFQRANDGTDLIVQKGPRPQKNPDLLAMRNRNLGQRDFIQCFHRTIGLTTGGAKGGEVVVSYQMRRPCPHGADIQRLPDTPGAKHVMGQRCAPRDQAKDIVPFKRRKPRVPVIWHCRTIHHGDGLRFQVVIQRL
jgi:hypothetical protein